MTHTPLPIKAITRFAAVAVFTLTVVLGGAQAASAAPNCTQVPLPPACVGSPTPSPRPVPPSSFGTVGFSPDPGEANEFSVSLEARASAVAPYADGAMTPFRVNMNCTNGYSVSASLRLFRAANGNFLLTNLPASHSGEAAGTCTVTTWDAAVLGIKHSLVFAKVHPAGNPSKVFWDIEFASYSWGPRPGAN